MKRHPLSITLSLALVLCIGLASTPRNAYGGSAGSDGLTEDIVKRYVTRKAEALAKSSTGPKSISVTFENIRFGKPRRANAQDKIDGIRGKTVYPVRVQYTATYHWMNEDEVNKIHYDYSFYKDSYDEWSALGNGPVR